MTSHEGEELFPLSAGELLTSRIGKRMTSFVRYSFEPKEQYAAAVDGVPEDSLFSMSMDCGPLSMGFEDGIVIVLGTAFSSNSVILARDGTGPAPALKDDPSLFPIDARDPRYSKSKFGDHIGLRLDAISVFKPRSVDVMFSSLPNEIGLRFFFEDGSQLVFGCGLDKMVSAPTIVSFDEIEPSILDNYIEIPITPVTSAPTGRIE
jgi:hypothetical protein